ncbi:hypothetical protein ACIA03_10030 [Nocardioides sp. NPDC051685]|uniref:hypothetical protein n=1 Tax=Nocardioides sp. NPDC051685 TaxID=3364334 RepID=UPI00379584E7
MPTYMSIAVALIDDQPTLLVEWEGQDVERHPIPAVKKNRALRFAAGEPGHRSTVWRLWGAKNADDVYLASRSSAGEFKVSLHQSGDWRFQAIDLRKENDTHFGGLDPVQGRLLHQWTRPAADEAGWTRAVTIQIPFEHLSVVPNDGVKYSDVRWIRALRPGHTLMFEVVLVPLDAEQVVVRSFDLDSEDFAAVVDAILLPGGEVVLVLAFTEPTPAGTLDAIDARLQKYAADGFAAPQSWDRSPESAPRTLTFQDDEGVLVLFDLALGALGKNHG